MFKNKIIFNRDNIDPLLRDVTTWATVDASALSQEDALKFRTREKAIIAYLTGESLKTIQEDTAICKQELNRMVKRCFETHPDGRTWGFRSLIPHARQKSSEDIAADSDDKNSTVSRSIELSRLFHKFPAIQESVDDLFLKKYEKGIVHEARIPLKSIHKRFLDLCREAGIKADSYPFSAKQLGQISLWKYLKKIFIREQKRATRARNGKDAARNLDAQGIHTPGGEPVTRPYQRVEFDAHLIDVFCTITIPSIFGGTVDRVLYRIWM